MNGNLLFLLTFGLSLVAGLIYCIVQCISIGEAMLLRVFPEYQERLHKLERQVKELESRDRNS